MSERRQFRAKMVLGGWFAHNGRLAPSDLPVPSKRPFSLRLWLIGGLFIVALSWSLQQTGLFREDVINEGGWALLRRFVVASWHPTLTPDFLRITAAATLVTLAYAVVGTFFSLLFGIFGALWASEVWWQVVLGQQRPRLARWPWLGVRIGLALPRGLHELLWGLLFVNIFGLDPLTAVCAIAIPYGAITAKVFAETLDETPRHSLDVLRSSGVSPLKAFTYSLIPTAFPNLLAYAFYRFECSIRAAAVLGIIGAGGLGYQILLSLQTLRYNEMWTLLYALCLLSGVADVWSTYLRRRLGQGAATRLAVRGSLLVAALLLPFSWYYIALDVSQLWAPRTAVLLQDLTQAAWPPRISWSILGELLPLAGQTLAMSFLAATLASLGGMMLAFPAASNFALPDGGHGGRSRRWLGMGVLVLTRLSLLLARAIPAPIWALLILFVIFPGILPGAIALAIYNLGILGRLMAEVTENLDKRPLQALQAQGASGLQCFLYGVLPATFTQFMAYSLYRWEIIIRATVIVGLVGAGGLGRLLTEQLSSFDYRGMFVTLLCYILLTFIIDFVSTRLRQVLR